MNTMTDEQIESIRERLTNATEGDWVSGLTYLVAAVNDGSNPFWIPQNIPAGECVWCKAYKLIGTRTRNGVTEHVHGNIADESSIVSPSALEIITSEQSGLTIDNATFIAHAKQDIQALLEEVERLRTKENGDNGRV
ncbi:hypothetical protein PP175_29325 (plasmid) [Aneurinibacillus sp. Ricciae_BoGa-3]|uniref:hypothetical protein n=1 Tax=Aneurinibacillus sp. Ricciae_BoGa-3 TaxID=3022697 RepID=UPI00234103B7|nr:hypothetical protein [Aneurinibacillus sp. Ricciae_BoGa-3]WCK57294.1 hypothetical protein PP175_29325 [Aneurinibacillus sp. Ricciae_BoGa-3]